MTAGPLDSADWWVIDLEENPVPGDPAAIASLAVRLLNQGRRTQQHGDELDSIQSANTGRMQGDYVAGFEQLLTKLPAMSRDLGESYQTCGNALDWFGAELSDIQGQAENVLEHGIQADRAYRSAAAEVIDMLPTASWPGLDDPGPIWRYPRLNVLYRQPQLHHAATILVKSDSPIVSVMKS